MKEKLELDERPFNQPFLGWRSPVHEVRSLPLHFIDTKGS